MNKSVRMSLFSLLFIFLFSINVNAYDEDDGIGNNDSEYMYSEPCVYENLSDKTVFEIDGKDSIVIKGLEYQNYMEFEGYKNRAVYHSFLFQVSAKNSGDNLELKVHTKEDEDDEESCCADILKRNIKILKGKKYLKLKKINGEYYLIGKKEGTAIILLTAKVKTRKYVSTVYDEDIESEKSTTYTEDGKIYTVTKKVKVTIKVGEFDELLVLKRDKKNNKLTLTVNNKTKKKIIICKDGIYGIQEDITEYEQNILKQWVPVWHGDIKEYFKVDKNIIIKPGKKRIIEFKCNKLEKEFGVVLHFKYKWNGKKRKRSGEIVL